MDCTSTSNAIETMDSPMADSPQIVDHNQADIDADTSPDKISAYYSLAFPNYTYYLQTLTVTIGRRSVRPDTASSSDSPQVDVDLGPLKSVSRLHAKIEYEESQERFVLVVMGRNGAWVDGVWSGAGSRVPLGARSTIQIATRTFHFILPPPPAPEDSPSPSTPSSTARHLSPSIDVTSLSPASSLPSPPPPPKAELPLVTTPDVPQSQSIDPDPPTKPNGKKRKKPGTETPLPIPEVMPPRPQFTYAQLCYRAIKSIGGKATLQEICGWISENYEWYRYNENIGWPSSVRHNLSSNRAFKKLERCANERGKGFFWSNDRNFEHMFEDHEGRNGSSSSNKDASKGKGKNSKPLEPALKRSVKGDSKSPLPPPLTSTPLPAFSSSLLNQNSTTTRVTTTTQPTGSESRPQTDVKEERMVIDIKTTNQPLTNSTGSNTTQKQEAVAPSSQATAPAASSQVPTIPSDMNMRIPIVIGPTSPTLQASEPSSSKASSTFDLNSPPISLQRDTIILNPAIFSSLTTEQLKELEALGAKKAIEILQSYIVRFLKERIKTEGAKAKGKKKKDKGSKKNAGAKEDRSGSGSGNTDSVNLKAKSKSDVSTAPFTTAPLPLRKNVVPTGNNNSPGAPHSSTSPGLSTAMMPMRISSPPMASLSDPQNEEIDIMGDDEPPSKKAKLDVAEVLG